MTTSRRGHGRLSEADLRIWTEVARTVVPLPGKRLPVLAEVADGTPAKDISTPDPATRASRAGGDAAAARARKAVGPAAPALAPLERRLVQRLRRGTSAPGAVIDLHGLRQEEARLRLASFLYRCQSEGAKAALVITGKGSFSGSLAEERGVLRRAVPLWLALPELRHVVIGFEEAGQGLGGAGALIVRIRSKRK